MDMILTGSDITVTWNVTKKINAYDWLFFYTCN